MPCTYADSTSDISARRIRVAFIRKFLVPDGQESDLRLILYKNQQQNGNDIVMNEDVVATQRHVLSKHKKNDKNSEFSCQYNVIIQYVCTNYTDQYFFSGCKRSFKLIKYYLCAVNVIR